MTERLYPAIISPSALAEFEEAIRYIHRESPKNAIAVARHVAERLEILQRYPRSGELDPTAPKTLTRIEARRSVVGSGFIIRYAFPVRRGPETEVVYVVSIRRAGRLPLDDPDYMLRFFQQAAATYA